MSTAIGLAHANEPSPWRFLNALESGSPEDTQLLQLTRRGELDVISDMVSSSKVALLYAYSGNGKTSLVNAGLIPRFRQLGYAIFKIRPRPPWALGDPCTAFIESALRDCWLPPLNEEDATLPDQVREQLSQVSRNERLLELLSRFGPLLKQLETEEGIKHALVQHIRSREVSSMEQFASVAQTFLGRVPLLFICDQFEELFVHYANTPQLQEFVNQIGRICKLPGLQAQFLFSMREDWVGSMVEFRSVVPDIFSNMYKLQPLRLSQARPALEYPLSRAKLPCDEHLVGRVLEDLSEFYQVLQRQVYSAVHYSLSPQQDPYIELPALQVVAENIWVTRHSAKKPFSLDHYESLKAKTDASDVTPARSILNRYLNDTLQRISKEEDGGAASSHGKDSQNSRSSQTELRLDLMYLLTDGVAHRRALTEQELIQECNRTRPALLLTPIDPWILQSAIKPLTKARLVRAEEASGGATQYELAHDFLVRSVVSEWEKVELHRAAEAAVRNRTREVEAQQLKEFVQLKKTGLRIIAVLPGLLLAVSLLSCLWLSAQLYGSTSTLGLAATSSLITLCVAGPLAMLGYIFRLRSAFLLGILAASFDIVALIAQPINRGDLIIMKWLALVAAAFAGMLTIAWAIERRSGSVLSSRKWKLLFVELVEFHGCMLWVFFLDFAIVISLHELTGWTPQPFVAIAVMSALPAAAYSFPARRLGGWLARRLNLSLVKTEQESGTQTSWHAWLQVLSWFIFSFGLSYAGWIVDENGPYAVLVPYIGIWLVMPILILTGKTAANLGDKIVGLHFVDARTDATETDKQTLNISGPSVAKTTTLNLR